MTMTQRQRQETTTHGSRDFSSPRRGTAVIETAPRLTRVPGREAVRPRTPQRRAFQHQPGSKQIFSQRGRRIERPKADRGFVRFLIFMSVLVVAGVGLTMLLTGVTTNQTYELQKLHANRNVLDNQIETLNRDLQERSSSAELMRRGAELGMVVPDQAGILARQGDGALAEQRPATDKQRPVVDINGSTPRSGASSNPQETAKVAGRLNALPNQNLPGQAPAAGAPAVPQANTLNGRTVAPYAAAPAPAPAAPQPGATEGGR